MRTSASAGRRKRCGCSRPFAARAASWGYDEQMRLAWLYTIVDRKREALDLWRDIWVGVESPARRSFAESQLLLLAAELGALGDMAVELEGMLLSGSANRNHMNLLVRIYTEAGDKLSATEIIDEYAVELGEDEVGQQELLAHVYMLLEDYPAHDRALRRLYEIDSVNRSDHVKSIIINLLTTILRPGPTERYEEITRWIGELRKFDEESVTGEFEASIYSTAGFADEAVEAYRRALVEQPENSDNLLLLADVMDGNNRTEEAVAILQFFAENAVEDNDFVVAVDGILNLVGTTTFFQQPNPETLDTLAWTRRVILERIAGRANKFYLYELLADIAREQGDTEASFVALENSLAEAGLRRPAVLRELLTMGHAEHRLRRVQHGQRRYRPAIAVWPPAGGPAPAVAAGGVYRRRQVAVGQGGCVGRRAGVRDDRRHYRHDRDRPHQGGDLRGGGVRRTVAGVLQPGAERQPRQPGTVAQDRVPVRGDRPRGCGVQALHAGHQRRAAPPVHGNWRPAPARWTRIPGRR